MNRRRRTPGTRWKAGRRGFRLGKKLMLKFEREHPETEGEEDGDSAKKKKPSGHAKGGKVHAIVRLDFSTHEKLSHQRWLDRIPTEEPFKSAKGKVVRSGQPEHHETSERFEALE